MKISQTFFLPIAELLELSCSYSGYEREKAVYALGISNKAQEALPFLFPRVNDWVLEVRTAAKVAILNLATPNNAAAFIQCLPQLYHLRECEREAHNQFITTIETFLIAHKTFIIQGIENNNTKIASKCYSLAYTHQLLDAYNLLIIGIKHSEVSIRKQALQLFPAIPETEQIQFFENALKSKFMPFKRIALQYFLKNGVSETFAIDFLFDHHIAIRNIAIQFFSNKGIDITHYYIEALDSQTVAKKKWAIWGIGQLRATAYLPHIEQLLDSKEPQIRKQALYCFSHLIEETFHPKIVHLLYDDSPSVVKYTTHLLMKTTIPFSAEELLKLIYQAQFKHTINACFVLLHKVNKWETLLFLYILLENIDALQKQNKVSILEIEEVFQYWMQHFNDKVILPTDTQKAALQDKMKKLKSEVFLKQNHILNFYLSGIL